MEALYDASFYDGSGRTIPALRDHELTAHGRIMGLTPRAVDGEALHDYFYNHTLNLVAEEVEEALNKRRLPSEVLVQNR